MDREALMPSLVDDVLECAKLLESISDAKEGDGLESRVLEGVRALATRAQADSDASKSRAELRSAWLLQSWLALRAYAQVSTSSKTRRVSKALLGPSDKALYELLFPKLAAPGTPASGRRPSRKARAKRGGRQLAMGSDTVRAARKGLLDGIRYLVARSDKDTADKAFRLDAKMARVTKQLKRAEEHNAMLTSALNEKTAPAAAGGGAPAAKTLEGKLHDAEALVQRLSQEVEALKQSQSKADAGDLGALERERRAHARTKTLLKESLAKLQSVRGEWEREKREREEEIPDDVEVRDLEAQVQQLQNQLRELRANEAGIAEESDLVRVEVQRQVSSKFKQQLDTLESKKRSEYESKLRDFQEAADAKLEQLRKELELERKTAHRKTRADGDRRVKEAQAQLEVELRELKVNHANTRKMVADYMKRLSEEKIRGKKLEQKYELLKVEAQNERARRKQLETRSQNGRGAARRQVELERSMLAKEKKDLAAYLSKQKQLQLKIREEKELLAKEKEELRTFLDRKARQSQGRSGTGASDDADQPTAAKLHKMQQQIHTEREVLAKEKADLVKYMEKKNEMMRQAARAPANAELDQLRKRVETLSKEVEKHKAEASKAKRDYRFIFRKGKEAEMTTIKYMQMYEDLKTAVATRVAEDGKQQSSGGLPDGAALATLIRRAAEGERRASSETVE